MKPRHPTRPLALSHQRRIVGGDGDACDVGEAVALDSGQAWAVRTARLFDGVRLVSDNPLVVVADGRVVDVCNSGTRVSADLPVVDLRDSTLLPGLVDSHVHLTFPCSGRIAEAFEVDDAALLELMRRNAQQALRAGITTVRDLGDRGYLSLLLRDEYSQGVDVGPEVLTAGPPITVPGGHCWFLGGEAAGRDGLCAAVRERVERGVDVIKIMATGGTITPGSSPYELQYTLDELTAATELAHNLGKPVTVHAHSAAGIAAAAEASVDSIEHGFFLAPTGVEVDWDTVRDLAAKSIFVSTTTARSPSGEPYSQLHLHVRRNFAKMHQLGVTLVCSSDAGVGPVKGFNSLPHGVIEFGTMLGMKPADALAAATSLAARACGVGDRKGRIAPGYDADFLVVDGNPLDDLAALHNVRAVFRGGRRLGVGV